MNRSLKQLIFGSIYLVILILIAGGIYFFYLKPAPSCFDSKQNQKETGIDCGGPCIPCELKGLSLITEEVKVFPAGKNQATVLAKVRNPSQNFSAKFSYQFELGGGLLGQSRELRGKKVIAPQATKYIVVPGLPIDAKDIRSGNLKITELNWEEDPHLIRDIRVVKQTNIDKNRVTVTGLLSNNSATNFPILNLAALLFDKEGGILNASVTRLEKVHPFSQKQFIFFFPEVEGLVQKLDPEKTEIQWELNE